MTSRAKVSEYVEGWKARLAADTTGLREAWTHWPLLPPNPVFYGMPLVVWQCHVPQRGDRELKIRLSDDSVVAVPLSRFHSQITARQLNEWILYYLREKLRTTNFKSVLVRSQLGALVAAMREKTWPRPGIDDLPRHLAELEAARSDLHGVWDALARHWDDVTHMYRQHLPCRDNGPPFKALSSYDRVAPRFLHRGFYIRDMLKPLSQTLHDRAAMTELVVQTVECETQQHRYNVPVVLVQLVNRAVDDFLRLFQPYRPLDRRLHAFATANTARGRRRLGLYLPVELVHLIITEFYC
jgi:hypothetical protein